MGSYFLLMGVLQAYVPFRASHLGADGAVLGVLLLLSGGGIGLVTDLGLAAYADARGREQVVVAGFGCALGAVFLVVLDNSIAALYIGCFLFGLGNSAIFDPLLALLTTTAHHHSQARTQGFNVSVQRTGALLAAVMIGITLASGHDDILALTAGLACLVPMIVVYLRTPRSRRLVLKPPRSGPPGALPLLRDGYRLGLKMFLRRRIVMAALVSVAVNLIFIETNSFVPLIDTHHGLREAVEVSAALGARDIVAIAVGVFVVATGKDASSSKMVVSALCLAAVSAAGVGLGVNGPHSVLILCCGLQGVAIGVGVAAMNLLTVGSSSDEHRAVAMAAATLINRVGVIVIPIGLGLSLQLAGLRSVFLVIGATLALFGVAFFAAGIRPERS
jgi:MFS family permease